MMNNILKNIGEYIDAYRQGTITAAHAWKGIVEQSLFGINRQAQSDRF